MNYQARRELDGRHTKKKMQEHEEDRGQPQEHRHQSVTVEVLSNSVLPLSVPSCSEQGQDEMPCSTGEAAGQGRSGGREKLPPLRRFWWGDCQPQVMLLREALLSSAPDIAVIGPLHGCFSFYVANIHNEVLSSTYARTMTLGANVTWLESSFMWFGGWRPTSALVLVYSLMGIDIENALEAVRAGRQAGSVLTSSLLSPRQLAVMHSLQKHTQSSEMKITKKLTLLQMLIGDQDMLGAVLLDAASPVANDSSRFLQVAERRMSRFRRLLVQAEELRLHTLKDLLSLLTPIQAARCGVAVFDLCSALRIMGSTTLPILPALPRALPTALPILPAQSALVSRTLVSGSDEPVVPEISPYDSSQRQSNKHLVSAISSFDDNTLNASDVTLSQSGEFLVSNASSPSKTLSVPHALVCQSDEPQILVPSCSNSAVSQLLAKDSSRSLGRAEGRRSLSAILPFIGLKLGDNADGMVSSGDENPPRVISNRLLLLSPASSDVTIQSCDLESSEFGACFEKTPQLPLLSGEVEEDYGAQREPSGSGETEGSYHLPPGMLNNISAGRSSSRISSSWFWSSVQYLKCSVHQKYGEWAHDWIRLLWRKKTLEIT